MKLFIECNHWLQLCCCRLAFLGATYHFVVVGESIASQHVTAKTAVPRVWRRGVRWWAQGG